MRHIGSTTLFIFWFTLSPLCFAETADEIVDKVTARKPAQTEQVSVLMKVQNGDGTEREPDRAFLIQSRYTTKENSKVLLSFLRPRGIKGTKILTIKSDHQTGQWVYLPAVKKTSRVNSDQDVEGILDSDLSYSDIKEESTEDYTYTLNTGKTEEFASSTCREPGYSVTAVPKNSSSRYSKRILSISKSKYVICGVVLYNTSGKLEKNIQNQDFLKVGENWRPQTSLISTLKTPSVASSKTVLSYSDWKIGLALGENLFTVSNLSQ